MSRTKIIIDYFNSLPEVKRIHELEPFIDNNIEIRKLFSNIKILQKQMVNSKEYNQINQYEIQLNEYNKLKEDLINYPFVEEYLDALDVAYNELSMFINGVEDLFDKLLNGD